MSLDLFRNVGHQETVGFSSVMRRWEPLCCRWTRFQLIQQMLFWKNKKTRNAAWLQDTINQLLLRIVRLYIDSPWNVSQYCFVTPRWCWVTFNQRGGTRKQKKNRPDTLNLAAATLNSWLGDFYFIFCVVLCNCCHVDTPCHVYFLNGRARVIIPVFWQTVKDRGRWMKSFFPFCILTILFFCSLHRTSAVALPYGLSFTRE